VGDTFSITVMRLTLAMVKESCRRKCLQKRDYYEHTDVSIRLKLFLPLSFLV